MNKDKLNELALKVVKSYPAPKHDDEIVDLIVNAITEYEKTVSGEAVSEVHWYHRDGPSYGLNGRMCCEADMDVEVPEGSLLFLRPDPRVAGLEASRDKLILAIADHVTVRSEQASRIAKLDAELATAKGVIDKIDDVYEAKIAKLEHHLAEAKVDAGRYRYLRKANAELEDFTLYVGRDSGPEEDGAIEWVGSNLDSVIDKALAATKDAPLQPLSELSEQLGGYEPKEESCS